MLVHRTLALAAAVALASGVAAIENGWSGGGSGGGGHPRALKHGVQHGQPGLRPEFDRLLGEDAVREFLAGAWSRPVTEFFGTPPYTKPKEKGTGDLSFEHTARRFDALGPVLQCPPDILSTFGTGDEEKHVCGLPAKTTTLQGANSSAATKPCVIISIGSANNWVFELAVGKAFPHCQIHTLDCTVAGVVPSALASQATFHSVCLGPRDEEVPLVRRPEKYSYKNQMDRIGLKKLKMVTWVTFLGSIGLDSPPEVLKVDIEGYEWSVLTAMAASAPLHILPKSISLELHYAGAMTNLEWYGRSRSPYEIGAWMDFMFTRGGYVLVDRNDNPFCPHCSEIVIARMTGSHERPARIS